jgi:hypothetical protein
LQIDRRAINLQGCGGACPFAVKALGHQQTAAAAVGRYGNGKADQHGHQRMPLVQGFGEFHRITHMLVDHAVAQLP